MAGAVCLELSASSWLRQANYDWGNAELGAL